MMSASWLWMISFSYFSFLPLAMAGATAMGPPYPRYIQRRRGARAATVGETGVLSHQAWDGVGTSCGGGLCRTALGRGDALVALT